MSRPPTAMSRSVAVGGVGVAEVRREQRRAERELPLVDHAVVAVGQVVPVEAVDDLLVGDHRRVGSRASSASKYGTANTWSTWPWVYTAVSSGASVQAADRGVDLLGVEDAAGVDQHQPVVAHEGGDVGEALDEGEPVGELDQRGVPRHHQRVLLGDVELTARSAPPRWRAGPVHRSSRPSIRTGVRRRTRATGSRGRNGAGSGAGRLGQQLVQLLAVCRPACGCAPGIGSRTGGRCAPR